MKLTLEHLQAIDTDSLWFSISKEDKEKARRHIPKYSNRFAEANAFLNFICVEKLLTYAKEVLEAEANSEMTWEPSQSQQLWEFVQGTKISTGQGSLVLIPNDDFDTEELSVPQEWVDIPGLVSDYYLAVQVDWNNSWLRFWGFTTHKTLKQEGDYDSLYRTYSLEKDQMVTDLEVMWLAIEREYQETTVAVAPLPQLATAVSQQLINKLSEPSPYSPRLEVPFEQWGALLQTPELITGLFHRRLAKLSPTTVALQNISKRVQKTAINLTRWLDYDFTEVAELGWQSFESLFVSPRSELAYRQSVINDNLRDGSETSIERTRLYRLQGSLGEASVALSVAVIPEADGQVCMSVEVYPDPHQTYLPPNLKLVLLEEGSVLESMISKQQDIVLQSDYYVCPPKTHFQVQILFQQECLIEEFTIT